MSVIVGLIPLAILLAIYFLPTLVALSRRHQSAVAIFVLNLLLGWTVLGWIVAFVWSFTNPIQVVVNNRAVSNQASKSVADEIRKLATLKEQGLLTEDEFSKKKQKMLENA